MRLFLTLPKSVIVRRLRRKTITPSETRVLNPTTYSSLPYRNVMPSFFSTSSLFVAVSERPLSQHVGFVFCLAHD